MEKLSNNVCVVTGGGSGIGRDICTCMGEAGAKVAILDLNGQGAEETAALLAANGHEAFAMRCDVTKPDSVEAARTAITAKFGAPSILVNNAGLARPGKLEDVPLEEWNYLLSVNLNGYFISSQVFGRAMLAAGAGTLVHVSSISADFPVPGMGSYSVSKAGVTMLSRQLAVEWGPRGVRSNAVNPGLVVTPLSQAIYDDPAATERRVAAIPMRRIGVSADIANAVMFLADPASSYVNGAEIKVDGAVGSNLFNLLPRYSDHANSPSPLLGQEHQQ